MREYTYKHELQQDPESFNVGQQAKPKLPPLRNTNELAMVIVAITIICADVASMLPAGGMQDMAIEAIVVEAAKHIDEYIGQHYGKAGQGADIR